MGRVQRGRTHRHRLLHHRSRRGVPSGRAFFVEALITFVLVLVFISVATDDRVLGAVAPLAVGAALAVCIFIAAPVTGRRRRELAGHHRLLPPQRVQLRLPGAG
ncbi:aquaporin [Kineococcus sp. NBC_00420]|uniref:aquaporin n=1 Tax=Kineococcus sp. NBC_00420 TaxID=2903564 RepID=UPI003FA5470A